jgi:hypothetical protein
MSAWTTGPAVVLTRYRGSVTAPDSPPERPAVQK